MRLINKIFMFSFMIATLCTRGYAADIPCLTAVGQDDNFISKFKGQIKSGVILTDEQKLQEYINTHKQDFYKLVGDSVFEHCIKDNDYTNVNIIADRDSITIPFVINSQPYDITVNTENLFDAIENKPVAALLVINDTYKKPGDEIKKSDMPKKYFFSRECSDHNIQFGLSNTSPVNKAGQRAFAAYGGGDAEFFLDFPTGKNNRAFPGLVIGDFGSFINSPEKIVVYTNYKRAREVLKNFSSYLNNTPCSNQNLAVYLVDIGDKPFDKDSRSWLWSVIPFGNLHLLDAKKLADLTQVIVLSEPQIIK